MVSIHTPARGVTFIARFNERRLEVSIHTPARGVTRSRLPLSNPLQVSIHTPARGVTCCTCGGYDLGSVSIHTPARGVTVLYVRRLRPWKCFNPHSRTGSDTKTIASLRSDVFQSTLPHGE